MIKVVDAADGATWSAGREDGKHLLLIAGDVSPVQSNVSAFEAGKPDDVFDVALLHYLKNAFGLVVNLETPIVRDKTPIVKSGPVLTAPRGTGRFLAAMNVAGAALANNHAFDHGVAGYASTVEDLANAGVPYFGGGEGNLAARTPLLVDVDGKKVGFYACAEHEFNAAGDDVAGANLYSDRIALADIESLSRSADCVVVLYHGMKEHYRYPSPEVRRRAHAMVDAGADLVLCQHSHCVGCHEGYREGEILYGQGDFCFTKGDLNEMRRCGLLVAFDVAAGELAYIPVVNDGARVSFPSVAEKAKILADFHERSGEILKDGFVEANWAGFASRNLDSYIPAFLKALLPSWTLLFVRVLHKLGLFRYRFRSYADCVHLLNALQCEAHRELIETGLRGKSDEE